MSLSRYVPVPRSIHVCVQTDKQRDAVTLYNIYIYIYIYIYRLSSPQQRRSLIKNNNVFFLLHLGRAVISSMKQCVTASQADATPALFVVIEAIDPTHSKFSGNDRLSFRLGPEMFRCSDGRWRPKNTNFSIKIELELT